MVNDLNEDLQSKNLYINRLTDKIADLKIVNNNHILNNSNNNNYVTPNSVQDSKYGINNSIMYSNNSDSKLQNVEKHVASLTQELQCEQWAVRSNL